MSNGPESGTPAAPPLLCLAGQARGPPRCDEKAKRLVMRITVRLHGTLRKYAPPGAEGNLATIDVPAGSSIADVLTQLGIPPEHAKMAVVGGQQRDGTDILVDGNELQLFPPLAGGC